MVKKICPDCHQEFECVGRNIRCKVCQEKYRRRYKREQEDSTLPERQERFWKDKPSAAHKYYQFFKFAETLTDDERRALITSKIQKLKWVNSTEEWYDLRSQIKILCDTYEGHPDDIEKYQKLDEEDREVRKRGVYDESDE